GLTTCCPASRELHATCPHLPCQPGGIAWLHDVTHSDPAISPGCSPHSTTCPTTRPKSRRLSMPGCAGGGWPTSPIVPPHSARSRPKSSLPPSIISRHA